jgi:copper chaperone
LSYEYQESSKMTLTLTVKGMNCGHCTKTITEAILKIDPQAVVETDIPSQLVKISSSVEASVLSAAVLEAGYDVIATQ